MSWGMLAHHQKKRYGFYDNVLQNSCTLFTLPLFVSSALVRYARIWSQIAAQGKTKKISKMFPYFFTTQQQQYFHDLNYVSPG